MELLKSLYAINSKSGNEAYIKSFVLDQLNDLELTVEEDSFGNIFITKGTAEKYPCMTAHLDEVHEPVERTIVVDKGHISATDQYGNVTGCGADDKNGLWIIIQLLHKRPLLKVALFVQEEKDGEISGCRGSRACSLTQFDNVKYILAVDRKGNTDVVNIGKSGIELCNNSFIPQHILDKYGYKFVDGGRTDVVALKERGVTIPCCNIGCGYYNAHKFNEYTVFSELQNCLSFVDEIIEEI